MTPILASLAARPELWNANDLRTTFPGSPHAEVNDIWCRFQALDDPDPANSTTVIGYPAWDCLPIRDVVLNLMRRVNGVELGRVIITRLAPGRTISAHIDQGTPATYYQRYHLVLQSTPGCITRIEQEVIHMAAGEAYWFNNRAEHEIINNGSDDRIVIIIDVRVA